MKIYPFNQNGIFNINADIKFLINEIDDKIDQSELSELKNINIDNLYQENNNIIIEEKEEIEDDFNIYKIDIEDKLNKDKIMIKKPFKENNLLFKNHSPTLASRSTAASIYDDLNDKTNNEIRYSYTTDFSFLTKKVKEITPNFSDEFETQDVTIIKKNNIITHMTLNLFLKKIVIGNFFDDNLDYIINFSEQCFYFLKREIFFEKIKNCYKYYTNLKVPFIQRKKLIDFSNLLVIKLFYCFPKIESKEDIITILKQFYEEIINELKPLVGTKNSSGINFQEKVLEGINYIKNSVSKLIKSDHQENKDKEKKEIKEVKEVKNIKENLNILLSRRKEFEGKQKNYIFKEEKSKDEKNEIGEEKKEKEIKPEEESLLECEKILNIIKNQPSKLDVLIQTEKTLNIYKLSKNIKLKNDIKKEGQRRLHKSNTERYLAPLSLEDDKLKNKSNIKQIKAKKFYFSCLDYEIKDIGDKLINISLKLLQKIKLNELYNCAFLKKSKLITSPNVIENINKFNNLILFIIEDILSYDFPQDRAKILERWVYIADYLKRRKDYNDILAINSALKNYIITGLNLTWKELSSKTKKMINDIDYFCSFEKNFRNIRNDMNALNKSEFYVPYLGLLLKDLNFYEENYKYLVGGNLINFEKINLVQKTIDDFFYFKKIKDKVKFVENKELNFFENLDNKKESYLENIASKLEPKFTLYLSPRKIKRLTFIDKNYFKGNSKRGSLIESIKLNIG